jgi:hypothetical protein
MKEGRTEGERLMSAFVPQCRGALHRLHHLDSFAPSPAHFFPFHSTSASFFTGTS